MFPEANKVLAGKYRLSRQLGQGGMGSVWLAEHLTLHSPVAIKLIELSIASNSDALARFMREAQAAASLRSPHVVQILDHGVDAGVPFIVMEALEGESLSDRLKRLGRLSPTETAKLMTHVGRAMTRAHDAGVVHRDLKPENVFIVHNDEEELAKVLDFGVAKSPHHEVTGAVPSATRTGAVLGTPYYMSPEQAEGARQVDHRTDIWAMGVIAHECLLGVRPFQAGTLGGLLLAICAHELPVPSRLGPVVHGFDEWFARACARDLSHRFASAREAAAELRQICEQAPLVARHATVLDADQARTPTAAHEFARTTSSVVTPPRASQPSGAMAHRTRLRWLAIACAFVVALAVGAWTLTHGNAASTGSAGRASPPTVSETPIASRPTLAPASSAPKTAPALEASTGAVNVSTHLPLAVEARPQPTLAASASKPNSVPRAPAAQGASTPKKTAPMAPAIGASGRVLNTPINLGI